MFRKLILLGLLFSASVVAQAGTIEMKVNGLVCAFCAQGIDKILRKHPATADVLVSLEDRLVAVETRDGRDIDDADLRKALTDSGYDVKSIKRTQNSLDAIRERLKKQDR
ncbi:MAG TPA: heavy-metal-associated domain-containing protein [Gemmatimonadaceae bacterium]|nr:heavy-metal-associated domain-containing protein [Gemmatimonadaceae bacterium]